VFYSIVLMAALIVFNEVRAALAQGAGVAAGASRAVSGLSEAMIAGAKSMAGVTAAVGAAGTIVVVASAIGLLAFCCVTQGWMLVRLTVLDRLVLLGAVFCLFWPQAMMSRIFPAYEELDPAAIVAEENEPSAQGRAVRLHVTRPTEYGDRYKLFVFPPPADAASGPLTARIGATFRPADEGLIEIADIAFMGPGEKAGLRFGDYVTAIDVERTDRPANEWGYPVGLLLIGFVVFRQQRSDRAAAR